LQALLEHGVDALAQALEERVVERCGGGGVGHPGLLFGRAPATGAIRRGIVIPP
jgi:hypothetical protein